MGFPLHRFCAEILKWSPPLLKEGKNTTCSENKKAQDTQALAENSGAETRMTRALDSAEHAQSRHA